MFVILGRPQLLNIFRRRQEIVTRIDAEHQHFDRSALDGGKGCLRVMTAHADVLDPALGFQLTSEIEGAALDDPIPILEIIAVMYHADLNVVGLKEVEHLVKPRADLVKFTRAFVLPVDPNRSDVRLNDELIAPALERIADGGSDIGIRRIQIEIVNAVCLRAIEKLLSHAEILFGKAFAAHADLADVESGVAECPVLHVGWRICSMRRSPAFLKFILRLQFPFCSMD